MYRGTSLIRDRTSLEPYSRTMPRDIWWSWRGGALSYEQGTPAVQQSAPPAECTGILNEATHLFRHVDRTLGPGPFWGG